MQQRSRCACSIFQVGICPERFGTGRDAPGELGCNAEASRGLATSSNLSTRLKSRWLSPCSLPSETSSSWCFPATWYLGSRTSTAGLGGSKSGALPGLTQSLNSAALYGASGIVFIRNVHAPGSSRNQRLRTPPASGPYSGTLVVNISQSTAYLSGLAHLKWIKEAVWMSITGDAQHARPTVLGIGFVDLATLWQVLASHVLPCNHHRSARRHPWKSRR
jgi:hypothetical protein